LRATTPVETLTSDEFRLAYALLLQVAALVGAWRFVRRRVGTDAVDRAADVLLLNFLVQYLAVVVPGLLGVLHPLTIGVATLAMSAGLYLAPTRVRIDEGPPVGPAVDRWVLLGCTLFAVGYLATVAWEQRYAPVLAQDALTYHFPAAVQWLRRGRIGLFETWFFNPANTYSPLAGSTFIAWWVAPFGHDVLARHVPVPALILVYFAAVRLVRAVGARPAVAGIVGAALVLSQPFIRQSIIEKDDLYLAAFFACFVAGCAADRLRDPLGSCRLGIAMGLLLATKYTALMALPALVLLADAPVRARWPVRRYAVALGVVLLIAGPWYLRNARLTGNPLYPIDVKVLGVTVFRGLFETARSGKIRGLGSVVALLTTRDQSLPVWPAVTVGIAFVAAWAGRFRRVAGDPLTRICLLGPIVAIAIFWRTAPYAEVRFVFPAFILVYAAAAIGILAWVRSGPLQIPLAAVILVPSWATGFSIEGQIAEAVAGYVGGAFLVTLIGLAVAWVLDRSPAHRRAIAWSGAGFAACCVAAYTYVEWRASIRNPEYSHSWAWNREAREKAHGDLARAWIWVCDTLPPTEPLAYTNTYLVHPLSNFDHTRPLVYVPTRRGVNHIHDLPHLPGGKLPGERLEPAFVAAMVQDTDADGWLAKLKASGATLLFVQRNGPVASPPEIEIIRAHPGRFEMVFENPAAMVYRLK
jgi:hypothetical protein